MEIFMARSNSPGYPNMSLPKAISAARKMFEADRRNPIDRVTAAKHIGYSGQSGASDKALGSLAHYGLTEKTGKGELRVSQLAVDIIHPDPTKPGSESRALWQAGMNPQVFKDLRSRFPDHVSEDSLRSYLVREGFNNVAIPSVVSAFFENFRFLEQYKDFESDGRELKNGDDSDTSSEGETSTFGGARVGDLIQWEINGALKLEAPMRVRLVTEDGLWVAVEGSETGIPMEQVIVHERAPAAPIEAPKFAIQTPIPKIDDVLASAEGWKEERLIDDGGEEIFIRYRGEPTGERYTYIRDYLDFKLSRMKKSEAN
jgi:hypothetical protein